MITLYGQVGYDSTIGGYSNGPGTYDNSNAWFVRGTARGYLTPNDRLEGTIFYESGSHHFTALPGVADVDFNLTLSACQVRAQVRRLAVRALRGLSGHADQLPG